MDKLIQSKNDFVITKMTPQITNKFHIAKNAFHKSENVSCNYVLASVHTIMQRTTKKILYYLRVGIYLRGVWDENMIFRYVIIDKCYEYQITNSHILNYGAYHPSVRTNEILSYVCLCVIVVCFNNIQFIHIYCL